MERNNSTEELVSAFALGRLFGFEPRIAQTLVENLGSAEAVFNLSESELTELFGPFSRHAHLINRSELDRTAEELAHLQSAGCSFIHMGMKAYPDALRECPDAPIALYVRTSTPLDELFNGRPSISVVGTRDISPYGREWCRNIVGAMAGAPVRPTVVSGMAIGVDITAHLAALEVGLPTIGVLPTGIDDVYPSRHRAAAERICATPGCALITDYPPKTSPVALNFLRRNRIIAGLSTGTILIESKIKGGGMMTARLAAEYGRDVFALPGRIDDIRSAGCNDLIQRKIAEPISNLALLGEALGLGRFRRRRQADLEAEIRRRFEEAEEPETVEDLWTVAKLVKAERGITVSDIAMRLDRDYGEVAVLAGLLESAGFLATDVLQQCSIKTGIA